MDTKSTIVGPSFLTLLGLLFIALKLLGITAVASWSWWLVLLPIWGPLALVLAIGLIAGIIFLIAAAFKK